VASPRGLQKKLYRSRSCVGALVRRPQAEHSTQGIDTRTAPFPSVALLGKRVVAPLQLVTLDHRAGRLLDAF
jgi:hypothetical protein